MQRYFLIFLFVVIGLELNAQRYSKLFELGEYKHNIAYDDHKVTFSVRPTDKQTTFTEPDRKYYWFSNNEIRTTQGGFSGRLLHGVYNDFYLNNNLKEQGQFKMGLKEGEWNNWTIEGILLARTNYSKGVANGSFYKYNKEGALLEEGTYRGGKINGRFKKHHGPDSIAVSKYKKGVLQLPNTKPSWFSKMFKKNKTAKPKQNKK